MKHVLKGSFEQSLGLGSDLLHRDLHSEVTTGHHNAVGLFQDLLEVVETLVVLHLGDDLDILTGRADHLTDVHHVRSLAHEGRRDEVHVVLDTPLDQILKYDSTRVLSARVSPA